MEKMRCWMCGKPITPSKAWTVVMRTQELYGDYCSRKCADGDSWGPIYRGSHPKRMAAVGIMHEISKEIIDRALSRK
jgi:ribosomal protein L24E